MKLNNFKLTTNPLTGQKLSDISNKMFFDSYNGDDNNDGLTSLTAKKTLSFNNNYLHILHGFFDTLSFTGTINNQGKTASFVADGFARMGFIINATKLDTTAISLYFYGINIYQFYNNHKYVSAGLSLMDFKKCVIDSLSFITTDSILVRQLSMSGCIVKNFVGGNSIESSISNITFDTFHCDGLLCNSYVKNSIVNNSIDLYTTAYIPIFDYTIFRKQIVWKWNSQVVDMDWNSWIDESTSGTMLDWVKLKLQAYASVNALPLLSSIASTSFRTGCKVIDDSVDASIRIYNCYDPSDMETPNGNYSLNNTPSNPALVASDISFFVGGMYPSLKFTFNQSTKKIIDIAGNEIPGSADLISIDNNDKMYLNEASLQPRNKISTDLIILPQGQRLNSFSSYFIPSSGSLQYYGMLQGLNNGKVTPMNCLLIEPFDTVNSTNPSSTLKKMFVPFNSEALLAVYSEASENHAIGDYVLYSELESLVGYSTNKNLSEKLGTDLTELGDAIVTNAIDEWDDLMALANIKSISMSGLFRYFKAFIIANANPS